MNDNKDTYTVEFDDENFFSRFIKKITKNKNQKLLTSGNVKVKYTSESISSMWRKTAIKAAILRRVESFTNLFIKNKENKKNTLETLLVKNDEYVKEEQVEQKIIEETKFSDVAPIIPKAVSKTIQYNSEVANNEKNSNND
ncbi:MAG: hypothetical protein K6D97_05130 [Clostridia bacterium]|nr:hypothetical protein [Clostridia bacterium]